MNMTRWHLHGIGSSTVETRGCSFHQCCGCLALPHRYQKAGLEGRFRAESSHREDHHDIDHQLERAKCLLAYQTRSFRPGFVPNQHQSSWRRRPFHQKAPARNEPQARRHPQKNGIQKQKQEYRCCVPPLLVEQPRQALQCFRPTCRQPSGRGLCFGGPDHSPPSIQISE